jgi:hypothetical protein
MSATFGHPSIADDYAASGYYFPLDAIPPPTGAFDAAAIAAHDRAMTPHAASNSATA